MSKFTKLALGAAAALAVSLVQANVVIDLFNGTQGPAASDNSADGQVWASQYGPDTTVQGLYRDIGVRKTNTFGDPSYAGTSATVFGGAFNWNVDAGVEAMAVVRWDGSLAGAGTLTATSGTSGHYASSVLGGGLGPLSLKVSDFFQFDILQSDLGFTFWMELYDTDGEYSKIKFESQAHFASVSTPIPVAAFVSQCALGPMEFADPTDTDNDDVIAGACSSAAFDIGNLGALQIILETVNTGSATSSVDLRVSAVRVIPEPGMLALVGLGLLGAAGAARRRKG